MKKAYKIYVISFMSECGVFDDGLAAVMLALLNLIRANLQNEGNE